jgi:hypothetical protein
MDNVDREGSIQKLSEFVRAYPIFIDEMEFLVRQKSSN